MSVILTLNWCWSHLEVFILMIFSLFQWFSHKSLTDRYTYLLKRCLYGWTSNPGEIDRRFSCLPSNALHIITFHLLSNILYKGEVIFFGVVLVKHIFYPDVLKLVIERHSTIKDSRRWLEQSFIILNLFKGLIWEILYFIICFYSLGIYKIH